MGKLRGNNYIYSCLIAYVFGLWLTGLFNNSDIWQLITIVIGLTAFVTIVGGRYIRGLKYYHYLLLASIVVSSFFYYQWRVPTAGDLDISHQISSDSFGEQVTLEGTLMTEPRINQKQRGQFVFKADKLLDDHSLVNVTGKIYVTAPLLQVTGLYPSMTIRLTGKLYQPSQSFEPWKFNFADYLSRQGIFSGVSASSIDIVSEGNSWYRQLTFWRHRIVQSHVRYLKVPQGNLLSSMVIGRRGVDLDREIRDSFSRAGLAHILAASGFHVSIFVSLLVYLTRDISTSQRLGSIITALMMYAAITGFYPSILRACLMGGAGVIALIYERSIKGKAILLLSAVILLLINPLWIWDLGFQLSFLATWGLLVCLPAIIDRLDWMPPTVANLTAVPLAATIWTLPLICYIFNYFPVYGIFINIITAPLVFIITIGGFISAVFGLFIPLIGSSIAYLLWLPLTVLIKLVQMVNNLPFNSLAVGEIHLRQLIAIYVVFGLICISYQCRKYLIPIVITTLLAVIIPLISQKANLVQVTIFNNHPHPTIVIQNKNHNVLMNLGTKENIKFNVLPFLSSQGINEINLRSEEMKKCQGIIQKCNSWSSSIADNNSLNYFEEHHNIGFNLEHQQWLIVNQNHPDLFKYQSIVNILIWNDQSIDDQLIKQINPQILIINRKFEPDLWQALKQDNLLILSSQNKTIQWRKDEGFQQYGDLS